MLGAACKTQGTLRTSEAAQLETIDSVMSMLTKLRADTLEEFQQCKDEEAQKCEVSRAAALELEPSIACLDSFVQQRACEVDDETSKAIQVHTEKLEDLQLEQVRFVNANDSPRRNPNFAKTIADLASTEQVLADHRDQSLLYKEFCKDWEEVLEQMPVQKVSPTAPAARSFFDRVS